MLFHCLDFLPYAYEACSVKMLENETGTLPWENGAVMNDDDDMAETVAVVPRAAAGAPRPRRRLPLGMIFFFFYLPSLFHVSHAVRRDGPQKSPPAPPEMSRSPDVPEMSGPPDVPEPQDWLNRGLRSSGDSLRKPTAWCSSISGGAVAVATKKPKSVVQTRAASGHLLEKFRHIPMTVGGLATGVAASSAVMFSKIGLDFNKKFENATGTFNTNFKDATGTFNTNFEDATETFSGKLDTFNDRVSLFVYGILAIGSCFVSGFFALGFAFLVTYNRVVAP